MIHRRRALSIVSAVSASMLLGCWACDGWAQTTLQEPPNLSEKRPIDVRFLGLQEARQAIVDESSEPYLSAANDDFLRFCLGGNAQTPLPKQPRARRELVETTFQGFVQSFSDDEQELISRMVAKLAELTRDDWPLLHDVPWSFLKIDARFCRGFPHTRGIHIVLSPPVVAMFARQETDALTLLLHEKLHVLQRRYPQRFEKLYRSYGYEKIELADGALSGISVAQNPDAFRIDWAIKLDKRYFLMLMVFETDQRGRFKFGQQLRSLQSNNDGTYNVGDPLEPSERFEAWASDYRVKMALEHPNEVSAYLSRPVFENVILGNQTRYPEKGQRRRVEQTRDALSSILRSVDEPETARSTKP